MTKYATREESEAQILVFWDINKFPLPRKRDFDPGQVRQCIKRLLESRVYIGDLSIAAYGVLSDVPLDILEGVYHSGIDINHVAKEGKMEFQVFVVAGDWKCSEAGGWEFIVDAQHGARCVRVHQKVSYSVVRDMVVSEFKIDGKKFEPKLSYWVKGLMDIMVEGRMPPVYVETDSSIATFMALRTENKSVHLCVTRKMNVA